MKPPIVYAIQLYRQSPGDLTIGDAPAFEPLIDVKRDARERLASYFNDERLGSADKPTMGRVIDASSLQVVYEFRMTPRGVHEVGIAPNASKTFG